MEFCYHVFTLKAIISTIIMSAKGKLNGGIWAFFSGCLLKIIYLLPMVFLWRSLAGGGADLGAFTLAQLLTYTCVSSILRSQLNVQSGAVNWHYEGQFLDLFRRPARVFTQLISITVGGWLPGLMFFSLPMALILPFFGVNMLPFSAWFWPCLLLSISLGFAVDFIFSCFIIRMENAYWLAYTLRNAIVLLLSGAIIPFALLPWRMGALFSLLPFGSLAAAALVLFTGTGEPREIIPLQIFWNIALWPLAVLVFNKSREKLLSYGG